VLDAPLTKVAYCESVLPHVRVLTEKDEPSPGFVARTRPVWPEFAIRASWWPVQEHQRLSDESDMVVLWIPKADNAAYERGERFRSRHIVHAKRWCDARIKITGLARGSSRWFPIKHYFTVVSSIHSVMEAYPGRRLRYARQRRGLQQGVIVRRSQ
jgi:hypothetical protein